MIYRIAISLIFTIFTSSALAEGYGYKIVKHTSESSGFIESGFNSSFNNDNSNEVNPNEDIQKKKMGLMTAIVSTKDVIGKVNSPYIRFDSWHTVDFVNTGRNTKRYYFNYVLMCDVSKRSEHFEIDLVPGGHYWQNAADLWAIIQFSRPGFCKSYAETHITTIDEPSALDQAYGTVTAK